MKILIPTSIDYDQLLSKLDIKRSRKNEFKDKLYFLLSRIHMYPEIHPFHEKRKHYRPIHDRTMREILGDRPYRIIKQLLINNNIIEIDHNYRYSKKSKHQSKGYKLSEMYNTGETRWVTISDDFKTEDMIEIERLQDEINDQYQFILSMYSKYPLKVNSKVYDYLNNLKVELMNRSENEFQKILVNNVIGRYITSIQKLNDGDFNQKVSPSNHRLLSTFTDFPKSLRKFIVYNNQQLVGLDISASQPYILSSLLNSDFYTNTTNGYNLYTIYNELYTTIITSNNTNILYNNKSPLPPIMWGRNFTRKELENINTFQTKSFEKDYYTFISENCDPKYHYSRSDVKNYTMYYLFNDNKDHRNVYEGYKVMKSVFPAMEKWITTAHKEFGGGSNFSKLLQRTESYLMINQISKQFISLRPNEPLFTIHDSLYTTEAGVFTLDKTMKYQLKKYVGITPNIHIERNQMNVSPTEKEIEDIMDKIRLVKTDEDYDKIKGGVMKVFLEKGEKI